MKKKYNTVLTIAGSDSGGGAGIQADIKTISACGCYAASAITAITVQNTLGVRDVFGIPAHIIGSEINAVLSDIGADAVKIGMLHSSEIIREIRSELIRFGIREIVLDPVMISTSGHRLIEDSAVETLKNELIPLARVITPNIPEAEVLLGRKIERQDLLPDCAKELSLKYSVYTEGEGSRRKVSVLLKAGHLTDETLVDVFYNAETDHIIYMPSVRIHTRNTHGTGCTLSSALASFIAKGNDLDSAAAEAKKYINGAIISGADYEIGHGFGPVNHFWRQTGPGDSTP